MNQEGTLAKAAAHLATLAAKRDAPPSRAYSTSDLAQQSARVASDCARVVIVRGARGFLTVATRLDPGQGAVCPVRAQSSRQAVLAHSS